MIRKKVYCEVHNSTPLTKLSKARPYRLININVLAAEEFKTSDNTERSINGTNIGGNWIQEYINLQRTLCKFLSGDWSTSLPQNWGCTSISLCQAKGLAPMEVHLGLELWQKWSRCGIKWRLGRLGEWMPSQWEDSIEMAWNQTETRKEISSLDHFFWLLTSNHHCGEKTEKRKRANESTLRSKVEDLTPHCTWRLIPWPPTLYFTNAWKQMRDLNSEIQWIISEKLAVIFPSITEQLLKWLFLSLIIKGKIKQLLVFKY